MLSLLIPSKVTVYVSSDYIKLEGPNGNFIKKNGNLNFQLIDTKEGSRLFVSGNSIQEESTALSQISKLCLGLVRGYRRRLRLSGIGFRAVIREAAVDKKRVLASESFFTKTYMRKRRVISAINSSKVLSLKIGYSHEVSYPLNIAANVQIQASRVEARTKATVISLKSKDNSALNQVASEICAFRFPDAYKGKGIHYDGEILKLKKGKRQG